MRYDNASGVSSARELHEGYRRRGIATGAGLSPSGGGTFSFNEYSVGGAASSAFNAPPAVPSATRDFHAMTVVATADSAAAGRDARADDEDENLVDDDDDDRLRRASSSIHK
eukprot:scaffold5394_cov274-Prasinococcus_capsulatus_cf.AAC.6